MNDKKSILICSHSMEIGGAERSLLDLLYSFDSNTYNVDLFLYKYGGEWLKDIPESINLLPESPKYSSLLVPMKELLYFKQYDVLGLRLLGKIFAMVYTKLHKFQHSEVAIEYSHKFTRLCMPQICPDKKYDLAISFLTPHYFVIEKVDAKCKVAWIHTDYSTIQIDVKSELKMWSKYDYIASISKNCTDSFLSKFPTLADKIIQIENILSADLIKQKAEEMIGDNIFQKSCINLLSIGRFSEAKNFDNVPEICKLLKEKGLNIRWYLLGYGGDEELIKSKIVEYQVENSVFILGKKDNPYPYIKECDVYVQPSRYEGKSVAVREAQILGKPVIITNYPTASSQLIDGVDGAIVPLSNNKCAESIFYVLTNGELLKQLSCNCLKRDYTNSEEVLKLYKLID